MLPKSPTTHRRARSEAQGSARRARGRALMAALDVGAIDVLKGVRAAIGEPLGAPTSSDYSMSARWFNDRYKAGPPNEVLVWLELTAAAKGVAPER